MSQYVGNELGIRPVQPEGISLRDWFAGQALAGLLAQHIKKLDKELTGSDEYSMEPVYRGNYISVGMDSDDTTFLADDAYAIADAMLDARTPE
jgi:hypothetical protein